MEQLYKQKNKFRNIIFIVYNNEKLLIFLQKDCNYL